MDKPVSSSPLPRIAIVYGDYPPNPPGRSDGGSDFLQHLAEGLAARGHEVTAVVSRRPDRQAPFTRAGVHVEPIIHSWSLRGAFGGQLAILRRTLQQRQIDIVHVIYPDPFLRYGTNSYRLPFVLKLAGRSQLVATFFGFGVKGGGLLSNAGLMSLFATANRVVITDANLLRRFRRSLPWWAGKARGGLVGGIAPADSGRWNGADLAQRKSALGLGANRPHIGFFGFWSPDKGLENLLEAQRILMDRKDPPILVLVGGRAPEERFEYEEGILELAGRLGIASSLLHTGPLAPADVVRYMLATDLCVLPFKVNPLGRSSLALALGLGVPTLVTRPPAEDGPLLDGAAFLESPDPGGIARSIARLLDDPQALQGLAESARRAAPSWSWAKIVSDYSDIYAELAGGSDRR
ncbi:MAG: glycosyltransferase family 4 protein [Candidatus Dormibacteraceae bacterium]